MRNSDHDGTEALHEPTAEGEAGHGQVGAVLLPDRLMPDATTSELSVIAAQLIETVCRACDGDRTAMGKPSFGPSVMRGLPNVCNEFSGACSDYGYDLLIKCLRTGAVHGLRMVFVEGRTQIFPLLETIYHAPRTCRSLSRRETGVLQMIARGLSNKCIAKSIGITPETVKTHVKSILSKLESRTRAQAVARAEAIGLL
jgi:DNA-binding CsgD family transcriptional regulator